MLIKPAIEDSAAWFFWSKYKDKSTKLSENISEYKREKNGNMMGRNENCSVFTAAFFGSILCAILKNIGMEIMLIRKDSTKATNCLNNLAPLLIERKSIFINLKIKY